MNANRLAYYNIQFFNYMQICVGLLIAVLVIVRPFMIKFFDPIGFVYQLKWFPVHSIHQILVDSVQKNLTEKRKPACCWNNRLSTVTQWRRERFEIRWRKTFSCMLSLHKMILHIAHMFRFKLLVCPLFSCSYLLSLFALHLGDESVLSLKSHILLHWCIVCLK